MPIRPPALDDRGFDDLVEEVLARIPGHTPEWTNPRLGDPGRTIIELFAWLTDTLLYRANLIPERQRLAFLRLLGAPMRAAVPARTIVNISIDDENFKNAVYLQAGALVKGAVNFETLSEISVLPVTGEAYYKRPLTADENGRLADVVQGLHEIYQLEGQTAVPYVTTPVFPQGVADPDGFDVVQSCVDRCLWFALLAPKKEAVDAIAATLGESKYGGPQLINIGLAPTIRLAELFEEISAPPRVPFVWEICTGKEIGGNPEYVTLDVVEDSTSGLTRSGVTRLALPATDNIGKLANNVRTDLRAGIGDRPPRLEDSQKGERLVTWLRLRPIERLESLSLSWVGINAATIDQRQTITGRVVGQSEGTADQEMQLPAQSVEPHSLRLQVEEVGEYRLWTQIDDLALAGRNDAVYSLDSEAGTIRFGDGLRGRIPDAGKRVRVETMRAGGGSAGNLPPGSLTEISGRDLDNKLVPPPKLKVQQSVAAEGGADAETMAEAEKRIPALYRHRDRSVTEEDYRRLAAETPGVRVGRVEVLPLFKPHQRRSDVPGVVSVMTLPFREVSRAPNPRPDRPFIERVHGYLNARRPLTTELYVIGCEYVPVAISVGITISAGFGRDTIINDVREAVRRFMWPLAPGGPEANGWPLSRPVRDREIEVAVARVSGVNSVLGINLFRRESNDWRLIVAPRIAEIPIGKWQLPELLAVVVVADNLPPDRISGMPPLGASGGGVGGAGTGGSGTGTGGAGTGGAGGPGDGAAGGSGGVAVPVVPEIC